MSSILISNISELCLIGEQLANNTGLIIILVIKIIWSIAGLIMTTKFAILRYKGFPYHRNLKILIFFVHYVAVYLLCLTNIIPHLYSLIKFITFKLLIMNNNECSTVETILEMSNTTCFIIGGASLFALYLLAISLSTVAIERIISTIQFRTYETYGIRVGVLLALSAVCQFNS